MAVDDLWYSTTRRGPDGKPLKLQRHGRGSRWRVRYTDPNTGQQAPTVSFDKKTEADRFDINIRADIFRGQYLDVRAGTVVLQEYAEDWRKRQIHRDGTEERVEKQFRVHVYPILGELQMAKVRPLHIQQWVKDRVDVLAPSSLLIAFGDLKAMFETAVGECIPKNPCKDTKLPEIDSKKRFIPTAQQVHALSNVIHRRYRPLPLLTASTGLRPSEVRALEPRHVDFLRRTVSVEQQIIYSRKNGVHIARPKTKTSVRTVEVPQVALDVLARHMTEFPPATVVMKDLTNPRKPVSRPTELLFTSGENRAIYNGAGWSKSWTTAVGRVDGIPRGFGLHGLRHYFATALIHAGRSVKVVQLALGHSNPTITLNTYVHEWPGDDERTRDVLEAALTLDGEDGEAQSI